MVIELLIARGFFIGVGFRLCGENVFIFFTKFGQENFLLFLIHKEKQSDFNILLYKTVLSISQNLNYATNLNDGSQMHCL